MGEKCVAILTGDIVNSTVLSAARRKALYESFSTLADSLMAAYPGVIPYPLDNFRGDGWQLVVMKPEKAFHISLFIRTFIKLNFPEGKLDSRIAIGIGPVDFIPKDRISSGYGEAYQRSGHLLDQLKQTRLGLSMDARPGDPCLPLLQHLLDVYDSIISGYTAAQSQAVHLSLQGFRQNQVGEMWRPAPITQASVARHLNAARWDLVKKCAIVFEETVAFWIRR